MPNRLFYFIIVSDLNFEFQLNNLAPFLLLTNDVTQLHKHRLLVYYKWQSQFRMHINV